MNSLFLVAVPDGSPTESWHSWLKRILIEEAIQLPGTLHLRICLGRDVVIDTASLQDCVTDNREHYLSSHFQTNRPQLTLSLATGGPGTTRPPRRSLPSEALIWWFSHCAKRESRLTTLLVICSGAAEIHALYNAVVRNPRATGLHMVETVPSGAVVRLRSTRQSVAGLDVAIFAP